MKIVLLFLSAFFIILSASAGAQDTSQDEAIIKRYTLPPGNPVPEAQEPNIFLVKLKPGGIPLPKNYKQQVLLNPAANWFIVKADTLPGQYFEKVFPADNNYKLNASFYKSKNLNSNADYRFVLKVTDSLQLLQYLKAHHINILASYKSTFFVIRSKPSFVTDSLIHKDYVVSAGVSTHPPKEEMVINDFDNSVNSINLFHSKFPALNSMGITVSVKENLPDTTDIDFKGRYQHTPNISKTVTTHATTMATIIAGGGNSFISGKGIAWGSRITSSDFINLLPDENSLYQEYNISVQNHSYGTTVENFYGPEANAFDESLIDNPNLVYVFSAGNFGTLTPTEGLYKNLAGFANLTGNFKQAKNIITVGSVDSFFTVMPASSKGPAYDGRVKPELVAYGNDGSSGAAAIASGTVAAVQAAYGAMHHDSLPANALVKAILINSADDVFNEGPDYYSGYGNVNTFRAVQDISKGNYFSGESRQDDIDSFALHIPANTSNIKISLVWNDAPAQPGALTALVNDLDIELRKKIDGSVYLPWVLNPTADSAMLMAAPLRKRDSLNVVEQITIAQPAAGDYLFYVKGHSVINPQLYFVAVETNAADTFQFITPVAADHFFAGNQSIIRWKSSYQGTTGKLEYSLDKGANWKTINNNIDLSKQYYTWQTPDTTAIALMRITIGNDVYISDSFDVCMQPVPAVILNCSDSVLIRWPAIKGISRYAVLTLGDTYLQPLTSTNDTGIVLKNPTSPFIAISPVFDNDTMGLSSYTLNYTTQGAGCYINNFLTDLTIDNQADLFLTLGTTEGADSVQFQQFIGNKWQYIGSVTPVINLNVHFLYNGLFNGINTFRAIVFAGTSHVVSNTATIYFFHTTDFIAKPNPLQRGRDLTILSSSLIPGTLVMFDVAGRKLAEQAINHTETVIHTASLAPGIYFLVIYDEHRKKVFSNKIVIQ